MTRWVVVPNGKYWAVETADGQTVRERWRRLSCIDAQVIVAELNRAHELGRLEAIQVMRRQVFEDAPCD